MLIGLWVLPRTWVLMREAINVLLEGVPKGVDVAKVRASLAAHPAVLDVHDLHVWALASSTPALTAHVVVADGHDADSVRRALGVRLHEQFGIDHVTLQVEADHCGEACGQPVKDGHEHEHEHDHEHDAQGHHGHVHR
ncbi:MAG: Metal cation efflux system protein CzcD [Stenotrophomonas maltophilia]|nr:MAG: Metal cation efflux system protein CzcD [Stenotrophomonas maltophilia]